jgi:hypothetical protein
MSELELRELPLAQAGALPEAESKEKHGLWDPKPELTFNLTLCPLQSRP